MGKLFARSYVPLLLLALLARIIILWIAGNHVTTPWSGGGDMDAYVLLARNLVTGNGYTYAHVPTAWRTPGYPLVIAGAMEVFGKYFPVAVRSLQMLFSVAAAWFCMRAARIWFNEAAAKIALLAALFFPTLLYFSGEFLSESLSAFFVALFLWTLAEDSAEPRSTTAIAMGLAIGLGALFRPNVAALGAIALAGAWWFRKSGRNRGLQTALVPFCAVLVFVPWVIRNYVAFGRFVVTTKSGTDAMDGALNPGYRITPGMEDREIALVGHVLPNEVETNSPSRVALGPETDLDRKAWRATRQVVSEMSPGALISWTLGKWVMYWFSTDQLLNPGQISRRNRILHAGGVFFYWLLLGTACLGWWKLRTTRPEMAALLLAYAILMTLLHTPFGMDTRIRAPLIDPLIAVLAGGGGMALLGGRQLNPETVSSHAAMHE